MSEPAADQQGCVGTKALTDNARAHGLPTPRYNDRGRHRSFVALIFALLGPWVGCFLVAVPYLFSIGFRVDLSEFGSSTFKLAPLVYLIGGVPAVIVSLFAAASTDENGFTAPGPMALAAVGVSLAIGLTIGLINVHGWVQGSVNSFAYENIIAQALILTGIWVFLNLGTAAICWLICYIRYRVLRRIRPILAAESVSYD